MLNNRVRVRVVLCVCVGLASCSKSSPTTPTPAAPALASPADGAQIKNSEQPITLIVSSGVAAGATYRFEVASDAAFATTVQIKDGIAAGTNGQTEVKLDSLIAGRDYWWRARAAVSGTPGAFSGGFKFTIGPAISISTPIPISPLTNATTSPRPALRVSNAVASGPAGALSYKFEVANSSAFTTIVASTTVSQGVNETGYIPTSDLPTGSLLYWRATALDVANGASSAPSSVQSFTPLQFSQAEKIADQLGIVLWTGERPPGSTGHATMGEPGPFGVGWQPVTLFYAPQRVTFQSPDAESLRLFDLLDRGFDPDAAIGWMVTHGYPTNALWYPPPEKAVIGLRYVYLASRGKVVVNSTWDVVLRVE